jgi:hypothetical protein
MKKLILVAAIAVLALGAFLVSCDKDKDTSCNCIEIDEEGDRVGSKSLNPASYGAANCSDLETKLRTAALGGGYDSVFSCS